MSTSIQKTDCFHRLVVCPLLQFCGKNPEITEGAILCSIFFRTKGSRFSIQLPPQFISVNFARRNTKKHIHGPDEVHFIGLVGFIIPHMDMTTTRTKLKVLTVWSRILFSSPCTKIRLTTKGLCLLSLQLIPTKLSSRNV